MPWPFSFSSGLFFQFHDCQQLLPQILHPASPYPFHISCQTQRQHLGHIIDLNRFTGRRLYAPRLYVCKSTGHHLVEPRQRFLRYVHRESVHRQSMAHLDPDTSNFRGRIQKHACVFRRDVMQPMLGVSVASCIRSL